MRAVSLKPTEDWCSNVLSWYPAVMQRLNRIGYILLYEVLLI